MNISKKTLLLILGITSIVGSRAMFALFNDPEGPNLVVVIGAAALVYVLSLAIHSFLASTGPNDLKKLLLLILIQAAMVTGLYFCLS